MTSKSTNDYSPEEMNKYFADPSYRHTRKKGSRKSGKKWIRYVILMALVLIFIAGFMAYLISGLPSLEKIENPKPELATRVYSIDGEVLDHFFIKNRSKVSLDEIPQTAINALIATEDKDFYSHWGVDLIRFGKAMVKNLLAFRLKEGASTITQQLSRNLYLGHSDRHVLDKATRKLREFITSVQLERSFTKQEIIEFYFNVVYFGRGAYGIGSAAQIYFGKPVGELTLNQIATLIAVLKGPAYYDPTNHPEKAIARRNIVLSQMEKYGYITPSEFQSVQAEDLQLKADDAVVSMGIAHHFVENVRKDLLQKAEQYGFDIYRDGLSVYTTLNSKMQRHANRAVAEHMAEYQKLFDKQWDWKKESEALALVIDQSIKTSTSYRRATSAYQRDSISAALRNNRAWIDSMKTIAQQIEVGFVALDPSSGHILAMVGGTNFRSFKYGLNHVTQIRRQVGSAFKPFVYTVAIDNGYPPSFELLNQPVTVMMADGKRWTPSNSDAEFGGKVTLREGLKKSMNLVAVRAIMEIAPVNQVVQYASRMGIRSPLPPYESLALGSADISPLEMTAAFGVFPNHGVYVEPVSILRIEDNLGNIIEENFSERREVLSEETAFIMTSMMEGVVNEGTAARVRAFFHLPAAGKTGTTNDFADAWFVGFTPQISAGVWVGFDNKIVRFKNWDGQGGRAAAPIWGRFMKYVYDDQSIGMPLQYFEKPTSVYRDTICADTKRLATEFCPNKEIEYFTEKTRPPKCDVHTFEGWRREEDRRGTINF